jgi:hypothetical protein
MRRRRPLSYHQWGEGIWLLNALIAIDKKAEVTESSSIRSHHQWGDGIRALNALKAIYEKAEVAESSSMGRGNMGLECISSVVCQCSLEGWTIDLGQSCLGRAGRARALTQSRT